MRGLITERHFEAAERWFPGIRRFYLALTRKPSTFLELVWAYEKHAEQLGEGFAGRSSPMLARHAR